jgi:vacuolar-type H+-ATPase subunit I/STV1
MSFIDIASLVPFLRYLVHLIKGCFVLQVEKIVFVVFFAGERARMKVAKICEAFGANRYPFPEESSRQRQIKTQVRAHLVTVRS